MFNFKFNLNFIPLSSEFVEKFMPSANGAYVKIYLYILNSAIKGESADAKEIALKLSLLESDVVNAIEYWQKAGLISKDGDTVSVSVSAKPEGHAAVPVSAFEANTSVREAAVSNAENTSPSKSPARSTAAAVLEKDNIHLTQEKLRSPELAAITEMAQEFLGKTLNDTEIKTLYWFNDETEGLGFSAELIMILLEYCVTKGKYDMRYIEKTAIGWHSDGVRTIEDAERHAADENDTRKFYCDLKNLFGIQGRSFSKAEEEYIERWHDECGMDLEMISLAYDYCIMRTNKLSFQYMDRIIHNWKSLGITTVEAAKKNSEEFKNRNRKGASDKDSDMYRSGATDYSALENKMNDKY